MTQHIATLSQKIQTWRASCTLNNHSRIIHYSLSILPKVLSAAFLAIINPVAAVAQTDFGGADEIGSIPQGANGDNIRDSVREVIYTALSYVGLAATVVIIIAGLYLVFSLGEDSRRESATKIILYAVIGMLVIGLSAAFVRIFAGIFT